MVIQYRNGMRQQYVGLVGGKGLKKLSVGKAEEKRGDVAAFVATTLPSNHFHAKEIAAKLRL